jgi:poly(3-hydroxybutyrate) depolymerase
LLLVGCRVSPSQINTGASESSFEPENQEYNEEEYDEKDGIEGSVTNNNPITYLSAGINEFTLVQVVSGEMVERRFLVHTSDDFNSAESLPLLFAFHGNGGTPESFVYDLGEGVEEGRFIGVYPDGLDYSWNLGPERSEADDASFTDAILEMLTGTNGVDASNPVALGWSNGAGMVHELAMESEHFVAIAPATSHMLSTKTPGDGAAHVSVIQFSGTEDTLVPYQGGIGVLDHDFLHAEDSTAEWADHNDCSETPTESPTLDSPDVEVAPDQYELSSYTVLEWEGCTTGARVVHVRMNNIGHDLPYEMIDGGSMNFIYNFLLQVCQ